jgi:RNA-directed DNA polymerase
VGVTPHPGDGRTVTGRRATGDFVQAPVRLQGLDLMQDPLRELEPLRRRAAAEAPTRCDRLSRLVGPIQLLTGAGERVRQNPGGRTAGSDGHTRRAIDPKMLLRLAEARAQHRSHPHAVRRVYLPKGKTGRRALGMPPRRDRMVHASMAQVLAAIYAPILRDCSSGFRPGRNTLQALRHGAPAAPAGAPWRIAGALGKGCDAFPPGVILRCLRKRIKDARCLGLVHTMRTAGVMAEGEWLPTYAGTPQGGLASPSLSPVVVHDLDCWREDHWPATPPPLTPQQQSTRAHPE